MIKNKKLFFYGILIIILLVSGFALFITWHRSTKTQKINSFEDCAKAGYPILESYPRQCKSPDGKTFVEQVLSEVCRYDQECARDFYCKQGVCTEFIIDISCRTDDDCQLINKDLRFNCCWAGACESIDYRENKWIAVNKNWFNRETKKNCPTVEECGPAPLCAIRVINDNYGAKCIKETCQKISLIKIEEE